MDFPDVIAELVALAGARQPTAREVAQHFMGRAKASVGADAPSGSPAPGARAENNVRLMFDGDVEALVLWDDFRGWGAYANVLVARGTLTELTPVIGPTGPVPRSPDDFHSGDKVSAYIPRGGNTVRVFVELARGSPDVVRRVLVHFQTSG